MPAGTPAPSLAQHFHLKRAISAFPGRICDQVHLQRGDYPSVVPLFAPNLSRDASMDSATSSSTVDLKRL